MFDNLGRVLKLLREQAGLSQAEAARRAGMGKSQLSKYENGKELPKLDSLGRILGVLGVEPLWLFYVAELLRRQTPVDSLRVPVLMGPKGPSTFLSQDEEAAFRSLLDQVLSLYQRTIEARALRAAQESGGQSS